MLLTAVLTAQTQLDLNNQDSIKISQLAQKQVNVDGMSKATIQHFILKNEDNTYGYAIFIDGNMIYHQPNIPAISGNKGFDKVEHAEAVALLAIAKLKEGESPPTLSVEDVEIIMKKGK